MKGINIDEVISRATKAAIREFDKEKRQEQKRKVLHNTRLLLKHYNDLKSHLDKAIDDISKLRGNVKFDSDVIDLEKACDELYIDSIKRSKTKTLIMISHIDMAMDTLKQKQIKKGTYEKYIAMERYFIIEKTYEEIAEELNCGVITSRRWIKEMVNDLGILLFGIDGLKLDMIGE